MGCIRGRGEGGRDGTFATEEGFSYDRMICENPLLAEGGGEGGLDP